MCSIEPAIEDMLIILEGRSVVAARCRSGKNLAKIKIILILKKCIKYL
jgi:hypothetical protein